MIVLVEVMRMIEVVEVVIDVGDMIKMLLLMLFRYICQPNKFSKQLGSSSI